MAGAPYVSVLVRAHLRSLSLLPKDELLALKQAVAELAGTPDILRRRCTAGFARALSPETSTPGRSPGNTALAQAI